MYKTILISFPQENTHPVEVEVKTSTEIDEIFDLISYEKGSSIIRMLHKYLGDEHFRKVQSNEINSKVLALG